MNVSVGSNKFKTKKSLKEAVTAKGSVPCGGTSLHGPLTDGRHTAVGPCAYTNRRWYATVEVKDGAIVKVIN